MNLFTVALRDVFQKEWNILYPKFPWRDLPLNGSRFILLESPKNQSRNKDRLKVIKLGNRCNFDNTVLFYCLLYSNAVGQRLRKKKNAVIRHINRLRELRNNICHVEIGEMSDPNFKNFCTEVLNIFTHLGVPTTQLQSIMNATGFETNEVNNLRQQLQTEQEKINDLEDFFRHKFSAMQEFCEKFEPGKYIDKIVNAGIISPDDASTIKQRVTSSVQVTTIVDKIVYLGPAAICSFMQVLGEDDLELRDLFAEGLMKYNKFAPLKTIEIVYPSASRYPQYYRSVMRTLNKDMYSFDWDKLALHAGFYLNFLDGKEIKLYVQIELAIAKNLQGESAQALKLLNSVIRNAGSVENSAAILSRAFCIKSFVFRWRKEYSKAQFLAEEALQVISSTACYEDLIICNHQLANIILYQEKDMENKKQRIIPHWDAIMHLCQRNLNVIPRSSYDLRLLFVKKALLYLGFSGDSIQSVSVSDARIAAHCISEVEKSYLNQGIETDMQNILYVTMCKSLLEHYLGSPLIARQLESKARKIAQKNSLYNDAWRTKIDNLHRRVYRDHWKLTWLLLSFLGALLSILAMSFYLCT